MREIREAANIAEQDRGLARFPQPGGDGFFGCGDVVGDLRREKPRQVPRRLAFGDRPVQ
jgi:hypothetical protein